MPRIFAAGGFELRGPALNNADPSQLLLQIKIPRAAFQTYELLVITSGVNTTVPNHNLHKPLIINANQ